MDKPLHNFFIHPQSEEELETLINRVNGIPALYTFNWKTKTYNPPYELTIQAEGSTLEEAENNAIDKLIQTGVNCYDTVELELIKLENKIYQINRGTMNSTNNN